MTRKLRMIAITALVAMLFVSLVAIASFSILPTNAEEVASVWDGDLEKAGWGDSSKTVVPAEYEVDETAKTVKIGSAAALAYFARESNLPANNGFDGYVVSLECDVDLGGSENIWIPIGFAARKTIISSGVAFRGTFDGKGHTVSNLDTAKFHEKLTFSGEKWIIEGTDIEVPQGGGGSYNYGLIAATADATVKNLTVKGVNISLASKTVNGKTAKSDSVGAIVGMSAGNITVTDCTSGGEDTVDKIKYTVCTGGLVGRAYAGIKDGVAAEGGGVEDNLVNADKYLTDGAAFGEVVFENCVNYVDISDNANDKIGGILGYSAYEKTLSFTNCVNYGDVKSANSFSGGIVSFVSPQTCYGIMNGDGTVESISHVYAFYGCVNHGDVTGNTNSTGGIFGKYEDFVGLYSGDNAEYSLLVHDCKNYGVIDGSETNNSGAGGGISSYVFISGTAEKPAKTSVEILRCFNYGDIIGNNAAGLVSSLSSNYALYRNIRISGGNSGRVANQSTDRNDVHQIITGCVNGTVYYMYDRPEHKIVWDVEYLIDAYKIVDYPKKQLGTGVAAATLIYGDAERKTVTGVNVDGEGACRVVIPASVEKIGFAAFAGKFNIVDVVFEEGSRLTEIGDWAFGGTSISKLKLPETVKSVGVGAFGDCISLADVVLPSSIESVGNAAFGNCGNIASIYLPNSSVDIGEYALDGDVLWIASDKTQYEALTGEGGTFEGKGVDVVTYPITIEYVHNGVIIDTEQRLFGKNYKLVNTDGKWTLTSSNMVGTVKTRAYAGGLWYCKTSDGSNLRATIDNMDTFLLNLDNVVEGVATVEARIDADKIYVPRTDLVYDVDFSLPFTGGSYNGGRQLSVADANRLLIGSETIPESATVTVNTFHNADGQGQGVPEYLCNAGTYSFTVTETDGSGAEKTYKFSVTVARKKVDLSLRENLNWKISKIENALTSLELLDNRGMLLYLYSTSGGGQYPSLLPLSNAALTQEQKNLGIDEGNYRTKTVRYSVVRNRNAEVEISIANRDEFWVTLSGNKRSSVGAYSAIAELTANANYEFVQNGAIQDNTARGVSVTIAANGRTATVEKSWYIVDINNWFVTGVAGNGEYVLSDREYGSVSDINVPRLMYGDVSEFGGDKDPVTLRLYRGEQLIGEFKRDEFSKYLNSAMPTGKYSLSVWADSVTYTDPIDDSIVTECNPVNYEVVFNVTKRALPQNLLDAVNGVLKGKSFTYDWDGRAHWFDDNAQTAINNAFDSYTAPSRQGTVWEQSVYDDLYGQPLITYNLMRLHNDVYYEFGNLAIAAVDPDRYVVYYKVSAPNYTDSIEKLVDEARTDYFFTITIVREIAVPVANNVVYSGTFVKADIADSEHYTVKEYDGYTDAGVYSVTLTLVNPKYYRWAGKQLGEADALVRFEITKSLNEWIEKPDVVRWIEGKFNEEENGFIGTSTFGKISYVITDTEDNVIYDLSQNIDNRAGMKAGVYILKATVTGTDNYNGLSEAFTIKILDKIGLPWWGTTAIAVGSLAVAAAIILLLWKLKVFEILTDKISLSITTRATVDATIAAIRAAKKAEEAEANVNKVKARERREAAKEAERSKTPEQKALELHAKAEVTATKAEKMREKASKLREQADKLVGKTESDGADSELSSGSSEEK